MAKGKPVIRLAAVALLTLVVVVAVGVALGSGSSVQARTSLDAEDAVVELTGPVSVHTNADGGKEYVITADRKTSKLDAGPRWFYGDRHPLAPFVGKTVTVTGERSIGQRPNQAQDSDTEVDVLSVTSDSKTTKIRSTGKPPWAGGPKVVGKKHPGYGHGRSDGPRP